MMMMIISQNTCLVYHSIKHLICKSRTAFMLHCNLLLLLLQLQNLDYLSSHNFLFVACLSFALSASSWQINIADASLLLSVWLQMNWNWKEYCVIWLTNMDIYNQHKHLHKGIQSNTSAQPDKIFYGVEGA